MKTQTPQFKSRMRTTSLVALFRGVGQPFEISRQPIVASSKDSALVQVMLATICGSDLHTLSGRRSVSLPCALGHEAIGVIAAPTELRDAYGRGLNEGDRITWSIGASCGRCNNCEKKNLPQKCDKLFKYGHAGGESDVELSGGFAEYIQLRPGTAIYRLPPTLTERETAPLNCALATVLDGLEVIGVNGGECAVVQGAGMLGIYAACYLRENGCRSVIVVDYQVDRLRMAARFGATHTFNLADTAADDVGQAIREITNRNGADLVVEVSGTGAALSNAIDWLGVGGRCLTLGFVYPGADVTLDAQKVVTKCLTIRGLHNYHPSSLGAAVRFIEKKRDRYPFGALIGATYPLTEIDAAFDRAQQGDLIRVAVNLQRK